MATNTTHVIRGKAHWAKVLGQPRMNTYTEEREWSIDLTPDAAGRAELKRIGLSDKLKTPKGNDKREETFISFRQREFKKDGSKNDPIKVVDASGDDWDQSNDIGNLSVVDVKFTKSDNGPGKPKGVYIKAVRVLDHVEFKREEFAPLSADDEFFAEGRDVDGAAAPEGGPSPFDGEPGTDDLNDDVPF